MAWRWPEKPAHENHVEWEIYVSQCKQLNLKPCRTIMHHSWIERSDIPGRFYCENCAIDEENVSLISPASTA